MFLWYLLHCYANKLHMIFSWRCQPLTEANVLQYSESTNSPSLIRYISLYFWGKSCTSFSPRSCTLRQLAWAKWKKEPAKTAGTLFFFWNELKCGLEKFLPLMETLYFGSATAHSRVIVAVVSWTIFLGCSLELVAFSFIFSKTFSCSECIISGSCKCSLVVNWWLSTSV